MKNLVESIISKLNEGSNTIDQLNIKKGDAVVRNSDRAVFEVVSDVKGYPGTEKVTLRNTSNGQLIKRELQDINSANFELL